MGILDYFFGLSGIEATFAATPSSATRTVAVFAVVAILGLALLLVRNGRRFEPTREEAAFIEVYTGKKDVEAFKLNPADRSKPRGAQRCASRALRGIVTARKTTTLATRALQGTQDLKDFIRKRLIPYLDSPTELTRAIDSFGILEQFFLDPTMTALSSAVGSLNDALPESFVPAKVGVRRKVSGFVLSIWERTISPRPLLTALFLAATVFISVLGAATYGFGATPGEAFTASVSVSAIIFVWAQGEFKKESESGS